MYLDRVLNLHYRLQIGQDVLDVMLFGGVSCDQQGTRQHERYHRRVDELFCQQWHDPVQAYPMR